MKIGIDIQTTQGQKVGFGFYVDNLVKSLQKIDHKNKYFLFKPSFKIQKDLSTPGRWLWDQMRLPKLAREKGIDILHQPCFSVPFFYKGKVIVTAHDIISRLFPQNIPFFSRMFFSYWMPLSYRKATKIITISESTKNDLIRVLKIPKSKIKVINLAAGREFRPIGDKQKIGSIKKKYEIAGNYFLHVGTLEPRKNLSFLIKVYAVAQKKDSNLPKLVITGKKGWYYQQLFDLVDELKLAGRVIFTGYVKEKDIPYLYNGAIAFLFPSIYEGFGLPLLEAMASGVPVISSNTSSMPEVIGEAGILLPPDNRKKWIGAIIRISNDKNLHRKLHENGLKQAKKFSWEKCAQQTLEVYQEVIRNN